MEVKSLENMAREETNKTKRTPIRTPIGNRSTKQTYLFEEVEVNTVSLFFSDKEIALLETGGDSRNIHGDRLF